MILVFNSLLTVFLTCFCSVAYSAPDVRSFEKSQRILNAAKVAHPHIFRVLKPTVFGAGASDADIDAAIASLTSSPSVEVPAIDNQVFINELNWLAEMDSRKERLEKLKNSTLRSSIAVGTGMFTMSGVIPAVILALTTVSPEHQNADHQVENVAIRAGLVFGSFGVCAGIGAGIGACVGAYAQSRVRREAATLATKLDESSKEWARGLERAIETAGGGSLATQTAKLFTLASYFEKYHRVAPPVAVQVLTET